MNEDKKDVKTFIKERYSKVATKKEVHGSCSCCCGGDDSIIQQAREAGYSMEEIKSVPADAVLGVGCGNLTALAEIEEGETVLDLDPVGELMFSLQPVRLGKGYRC